MGRGLLSSVGVRWSLDIVHCLLMLLLTVSVTVRMLILVWLYFYFSSSEKQKSGKACSLGSLLVLGGIFFGPQQVETEGQDCVISSEISLCRDIDLLLHNTSRCLLHKENPKKNKKPKPKQNKEIKGKTKAPLEFFDCQNCDKSQAECVEGQTLRGPLQSEPICWSWSRFSSTCLRLSSCQNLRCRSRGFSQAL